MGLISKLDCLLSTSPEASVSVHHVEFYKCKVHISTVNIPYTEQEYFFVNVCTLQKTYTVLKQKVSALAVTLRVGRKSKV